MRPILVLLLVIAALGAFFLAFNSGNDEAAESSGIQSPDQVALPVAQEPEITELVTPPEGRSALSQANPLEAPPEVIPEQRASLGAGLRGYVQLEDGDRVPGAKVTLTRFSPTLFIVTPTKEERATDRVLTTDDRGRFAFDSVDPHEQFALIVAHAKFGRKEVSYVQATENGANDGIVITLNGGMRVHGTVTDERGNVVKDAVLILGQTALGALSDGDPGTTRLIADEGGSFEFMNVPDGNYSLSVEATGYARVTIQQLNVTAPDPLEQNVVLQVAHMIGGVVVSSTGDLIQGATVRAFSTTRSRETTITSTESDENGSFLFDDVRQGDYNLHFSADGFRNENRPRVQTGEMTLRLELEPLPKIRGRVVDASGAPLRNFAVQLRTAPQSSSITMSVPNTEVLVRESQDGSFEIPASGTTGEFVVEAKNNRYAPSYSDRIHIGRDGDLEGVVVRMTVGATLSGRVIDADGRPVAGARVKTHDSEYTDDPFIRSLGEYPSRATEREVQTSAEGAFEIRGLTPATYLIEVRHVEYGATTMRQIFATDCSRNEIGELRMLSGSTV
ncbi:MAG: carboxypeptidase regulatory-like domain-containing protein, partial [Planctomycetota bacterium]